MVMKGLIFLASAMAAQAATIVSVSGPVNFSGAVGSEQALTAGFSTSQAYSDIAIRAFISGPSSETYTAYLTTSIGPGTTIADQVATVAQNFPGFSPGTLTPIFTGLSLAPSTYYLTIFNSATTNGAWSSTNAPTFTTAPGASYVFSGYFITNGNPLPYPPAANFVDSSAQGQTLIFTVATAEIPEPATAYLAIVILLIAAALKKRISRAADGD